MPRAPITVDTIVASLAKDYAALIEILGGAIALMEDEDLRDLVLVRSGFPTDMAFAAGFGVGNGWIEFAQGSEPRVVRVRPEAMIAIDIATLSARDGQFRERFGAAVTAPRVREAAARKLTFLFRPLRGPTREEAAKLDPWIPLLEKPAYLLCAKIVQVLDENRQMLVSHLRAGETQKGALLGYWAMVETMARLTLLASDPEARPWLADMAASFEWQRWTPSMPLLRERACWLAACAARSAIAFGPAVIPKYLDMVRRSRHPMTTFDALYGLSAIGLSAPNELKSLAKEIHLLRDLVIGSDGATSSITENLLRNCLDTLRAGEPTDDIITVNRALGWQRGNPEGLATSAAMRADPTHSLSSGRRLGFAVLPLLVGAPKETFYRLDISPDREHGLRVGEIEQLFRRAWIHAEEPTVVYH